MRTVLNQANLFFPQSQMTVRSGHVKMRPSHPAMEASMYRPLLWIEVAFISVLFLRRMTENIDHMRVHLCYSYDWIYVAYTVYIIMFLSHFV